MSPAAYEQLLALGERIAQLRKAGRWTRAEFEKALAEGEAIVADEDEVGALEFLAIQENFITG